MRKMCVSGISKCDKMVLFFRKTIVSHFLNQVSLKKHITQIKELSLFEKTGITVQKTGVTFQIIGIAFQNVRRCKFLCILSTKKGKIENSKNMGGLRNMSR